MNTFRLFIPWFFLVVGLQAFISGCSEKIRQQSTQAERTDSLNQKTVDIVYYVWVDNLRVRKKPGKDGEVIRELKNMEKLIYLNEKSDFTEEINLRGRVFNEPWLKVKLSGGEIGWVYGGGVTSSMKQSMESNE